MKKNLQEFVWPWWFEEDISLYNPDCDPSLIPFKPDFSRPASAGTLRDQLGRVMEIIARNYSHLAVKHIEGNPQDGQFAVMNDELETSGHEYKMYSGGSAIGTYGFTIELLDSDVTSKRFTFHRSANVKRWHRGKSYWWSHWDKNGKYSDKWNIEKAAKPARQTPQCGCKCLSAELK